MILSPLECYDPKIYNGYLVPCGKCYACKLKKSNDWSIRLHEEFKHWNAKCLFITLTYEDSQLNYYKGLPVLYKRDVQLYIKRLRHYVDKLTYFCVGEYGPTTLRPHYHAIIFGLDMSSYDDIVNAWKKGFITCSPVSSGRIAYVAKYSLLPSSLPSILMEKEVKPFMLCSKGIGISFLESPQIHSSYQADLHTYYNDNGFKKSLPRYYKEKLFTEEQRKQFAENYMDNTREFRRMVSQLSRADPEALQAELKKKQDWVYAHRYDVENRLLKKPKI